MAEELRLFLRAGIWIALAGGVYWVVSAEPAGTALLGFLLVALVAFVLLGAAMAPGTIADLRASGALRAVNRLIGFHERLDAPPPMGSEGEVVPLTSAWPIVTAAALVVIGLGLVFGAWLLLPGIVLLVVGGIGWLTQLDR